MGVWGEDLPIDAALLERMARIARDLPGHVVSVDSGEHTTPTPVDIEVEEPPESGPVVRIDGVVAETLLERYYDQLAAS